MKHRGIDVQVIVTLSKTFTVYDDDYQTEEEADEDGKYLSYDFSNCDLYEDVKNQIVLPQNLAEFTEKMFSHDLNLKAAGMPKYLKDAIADCKGWNVEEFEVEQI